MLGYAVEARSNQRKPAPGTLALIIVGHAALIVAVMSAKMTLPERFRDPPIIVDSIDLPKDPPPPEATPRSSPVESRIDQVPIIVPTLGLPDALPLDRGPPTLFPPLGSGSGDALVPQPNLDPPAHVPVRAGPRMATPDSALRPPYPEAKRRLEEEDSLRLRLSIDDQGRVRSVDPVGRADPVFLDSARKHLLRHWRYTPATEDGRAIPAVILVTLRFRLDD